MTTALAPLFNKSMTHPVNPDKQQVDLSFYHGLGDIANFARLLKVYQKYGIDVRVRCEAVKELVIKAAGATLLPENGRTENHPWFIQSGKLDNNPGNNRGWSGNKTGSNMIHYGLESKANCEQLWADLKAVDIQVKEFISQDDFNIVDGLTANWPRPFILWHSIGNTNQKQKSFNKQQQEQFTYELLNRFDGTLILLDWDSRVTWCKHHRLKHLIPEFGAINLYRLAALMYRSDLMIGIDSGPFYFSALTIIPSVGIYFDSMHPAEYMIPLSRAMTITMGSRNSTIDRGKRFEYQICESNSSMSDMAEWCSRMVKPRRYLPDYCDIAADVQLQQIIQQKLKGTSNSQYALSTIYDRNRSFDVLFCKAKQNFPIGRVNIVETGCMRAPEDWGGAGFSTAIFGRYAQLVKGSLTSFDLSETNCRFASNWCRQFAPYVNIVVSRGDEGISKFPEKIDILYLDSLDSESPGHQEENLKEFKAAESKLHPACLVCIDDTPAMDTGKGVLTVKYMLERGWKIIYAGYQVVLERA